MNGESGRLIVAVDGGGSTCRVCIAALDGMVLGRATGGPANINSDYEASLRNLHTTIANAYQDAGLSGDRAKNDYAYMGLAGTTDHNNATKLRNSLDFFQTKVTGDVETTVQGALGDGDGTVALFGTGSFYLARQDGASRRVGGWGFRLCDDGGGAYLGLGILRLTVQAFDGLIDHSPLTQEILHRFGGALGQMVSFAQTATPLDFGAFAREIVTAFADGDKNAELLVGRAVTRMHDTLDNLGVLSIGKLCLLGGLGPFYRTQLRPDYRDICENPAGDALSGAIQLAQIELVGAKV